MNTKKYQWVFYFIAATIIATILVQFYWNYKNYEENKQRVFNEIQLSLDNAVEEYYSSLAKRDFITIITPQEDGSNIKFYDDRNKVPDSLAKKLKKIENARISINTVQITSDENISDSKIDSMLVSAKNFANSFNKKQDSIFREKNNIEFKSTYTQFTDDKNGYHINKNGKKKVKYFKGKKAADSLRFIKSLKPIFISFLNKTIDYKKIDSLIDNQLKNKGINLKTSFHHLKNDTILKQTKDTTLRTEKFSVIAKSTYLKTNELFKLYYNNPYWEALKRSFGGISISFILSLLIISCLFYLLRVINQQKELASIKNDLISNITHEFKTPIATVSTAIEAIQNFNVLDDKVKTQKYISMSSVQLKKLHQMVEKLLETATLDSEQLLLKKETIDIVEVIEKTVQKHQIITQNKSISFTTNLQPIYLSVDVFHLENVISNLIDNAIKYGGESIQISINSILNEIEISIADNGIGIEKNQQEKIFHQFYRIPRGNTHDVKGFGIGLYYCKKIIEKHHGTIALQSDKNGTIFKIKLPNE